MPKKTKKKPTKAAKREKAIARLIAALTNAAGLDATRTIEQTLNDPAHPLDRRIAEAVAAVEGHYETLRLEAVEFVPYIYAVREAEKALAKL